MDLGDGSDDPISKGNGITQNRPQDPNTQGLASHHAEQALIFCLNKKQAGFLELC